MSLVIYNTMTRKKEDFEPLDPTHVRMYVCGPTVYDFLHVGNFRGAIFFNMVRNWLERSGYDVTYVYNYTDVDDKIINRANKEGVESSTISERYIEEFEKDYMRLGLRKHTHNPRVSEFIEPIIKIIQRLIDNKKAYVAGGEVIYSIKTFVDYGKLSGKAIEDLQAGARVAIDEKKENPLDFTLWKPAKPGEPKWPSPWGDGRPGWHIECSAMSSELLGDSFDIHGGGIDLIFPHHENEIAQSEGASGKPFAKYWMHNNFINFGAHKMSKSLGNVTTARNFMNQYHPEILKALILLPHYRSHSDFSQESIDHAIHGLARVYSALVRAEKIIWAAEGQKVVASEKANAALEQVVASSLEGIRKAMDDDFNTPEVFARIFEVVRVFNGLWKFGQKLTPEIVRSAQVFGQFVLDQGRIMALYQEPPTQFLGALDDILLSQKNLKRDEVDQIVRGRMAARAAKDWAKSDEIRDQLSKMGIMISDTAEGTIWEVQK